MCSLALLLRRQHNAYAASNRSTQVSLLHWLCCWQTSVVERIEIMSYNKDAVNKAIATSRKPISGKEAKLIHALLKGRK
jgi:hypothetical protein